MRVDSRKNADVEKQQVPVTEVRSLVAGALASLGLRVDDVEIITDHLVDAALCGYEFAGVPRVLAIEEAVQRWGLGGEIITVRDDGPLAAFDGAGRLGYVTVSRATDWAITRAKECGLALATVSNSVYSGRNAHYVERIARAGCIGLQTCSSGSKVAPFGGSRGALGTNPIAWGFPAVPDPVVIDFATSTMSWGDLELHERLGLELPEGVAVDAAGEPTRSAADVLDGGAVFPFGGHKGYGVSLSVQFLGLLAKAVTPADGAPGPRLRRGYVVMAVDPASLCGLDEYKALSSALIAELSSQEGVRVPSGRAFADRRAQERDGLVVSTNVLDAVARIRDGGRSTDATG